MSEALSAKTRAIGRYSILRELRRERHSVSYAAVDPVMNRQLVIKAVELTPAGPRLSADERKRVEEAFVRQAQAAGRLQHPHIVTVFDAGLSHAFGFLVIERINGKPLHELLAGGLRPAFVQCASIGARIADALECAHSNGVAHAHLGPQHVTLMADGTPKVSGFGGWIDDGATGDEALAGTSRLLPYFQNEITEETRQLDVRAIGELIFMMLTGRAPVRPSGGREPQPPSPTLAARPDTPPALARIVDQALRAGAGAPAMTAGALRDALTSFIWNERTDNVAPATLGIPLAAPPQRAPVHSATISPAAAEAPPPGLELLREDPSPKALPANRPVPVAEQSAVSSDLITAARALGIDIPALVERVRPWATRNRLPLFIGGTLLSIGIFLGVLLGNVRHPETGPLRTPSRTAAETAAVEAPPAGPGATASLALRPWGEVIVDGRPIGVSPPMTQLELSAGHHRIEVRHATAPPWQTDIDVPAPAPIRIEHTFETSP